MENRFLIVMDELEKARKGVAAYAVVVLGLFILCAFFAEPALHVLVRPLGRKLVAYNPADGFLTLLSLSIYCGLVLSFPLGVFMIWRGIVLRRKPEWTGWGALVIAIATALFFGGILLGYFVLLPAGIRFLVGGFETPQARALISARKFVSFCGTILIALGAAFEAPLISYFLARVGWLRPRVFRRYWRHAVLVCAVVAAVITPTPDIYNMSLMMIPLVGLYLVSYLVVAVAGKDSKVTGEPGGAPAADASSPGRGGPPAGR